MEVLGLSLEVLGLSLEVLKALEFLEAGSAHQQGAVDITISANR